MTTYGKGPAALISAMEASVGVHDKRKIGKVLDVARKLSVFKVSQGKVFPGARAIANGSRAKVKTSPPRDRVRSSFRKS